MRSGSALVVMTTLIAGCATPNRRERAAVLSLPYTEFDQAYGDGWRALFERGDGTLITGSDPQWLDDAVQRFIKSWRKINGDWEAPFGVSSNFDPSQRVRPIK